MPWHDTVFANEGSKAGYKSVGLRGGGKQLCLWFLSVQWKEARWCGWTKPCHLRSNVNFVGKNHLIYLNNFFSTIKLDYDLFKDVIYCCTMAQANRKDFLKDLATTSLLVKCLKWGKSIDWWKDNILTTTCVQ